MVYLGFLFYCVDVVGGEWEDGWDVFFFGVVGDVVGC